MGLPARPSRRRPAIDAVDRISSSIGSDTPPSHTKSPRVGSTRRRRRQGSPESTGSSPPMIESDSEEQQPKAKRRRVATAGGRGKPSSSGALYDTLFGSRSTVSLPSVTDSEPCLPPLRRHATTYHRPVLLRGPSASAGRRSLLEWFDSVSTTRRMPWRKPWIDPALYADEPASQLRSALERRAYEVWISEIMLQQTRVAVVIDYWNRWMAKWPTIQDLAAASAEDVLAAWRGLGYYSRATRIHQAAQLVVADASLKCLLPSEVGELQRKVPGVGRYTAGAISAIVFGHAAPMVDGNVLRVLSRQLGLYGNVKTNKSVIDLLWAAAEALVRAVADDDPPVCPTDGGESDSDGDAKDSKPRFPSPSDRPGRWGQALMELGSTVCTPKPNCAQCPITDTCRAYAEGQALANKSSVSKKSKKPEGIVDIEDSCSFCESFEGDGEDETGEASGQVEGSTAKGPLPRQTKKQATLSSFRFTRASSGGDPTPSSEISSKVMDARKMDMIANHARKFPLKVAKKAVREEQTLVCAIHRLSDGRFLIAQRPTKGLLAGLWELPSHSPTDDAAVFDSVGARKKAVVSHVSGLLDDDDDDDGGSRTSRGKVVHVGELDNVPWVFSHLKLTMHVHLLTFDDALDESGDGVSKLSRHRWADRQEVDDESMGTGMRKCWALVKEAI